MALGLGEIVAISKAAGELVKENKQKIAAVLGAVKRPEIAREMGVDINNPEQVKAAIQALEYENSRLVSPTPEVEILNKIRRRAGLSEIVDESTTDSEVDVHHDDDTASLDLGFDAKKKGGKKNASKPKKTLAELVNSINIEEKSFWKTRHLIPYSGAKGPQQRYPHEKLSLSEEAKKVEEFLDDSHNVIAADGRTINLRSVESVMDDKGKWSVATLENRAKHLICKEDYKGVAHNELDYDKLSWVYNIPETLHTAQAVYINEKGKRKILAYAKNYEGTLHIVLVDEKGETFGHLVTQFPQIQNKPHAFLQGAYLWSTPNILPIDSPQQARSQEVKQRDIPSSRVHSQQSENSAESQEENSDNSEFNAKKDEVVDNNVETSSASVVDNTQKEIEQKATESYNVIRKLADAVFAKTKAIF